MDGDHGKNHEYVIKETQTQDRTFWRNTAHGKVVDPWPNQVKSFTNDQTQGLS